MTMAEILQVVLSTGLAALGWFARVLWGAVAELKDDLAELKQDLPVSYIRKDDFKDFRQDVIDALHRIEEILAKKQDK
jgi:hypothetical protein